MKKFVFVIIGLCVVVIGMIAFLNYHNEIVKPEKSNVGETFETNDDKQNIDKSLAAAEKYNEEIGQLISYYHDHYNEKTGWGRINSFDWGEFEKNRDELIKQLDTFIPQIDDPSLKTDFIRIKSLIVIASQNKDTTAVRYIHRIFHDLDIKYNGYDASDFGVSEYGEGDHQNQVSTYIKKHEELVTK
jgi:hypothetical protein